jgi:hypothetical protein
MRATVGEVSGSIKYAHGSGHVLPGKRTGSWKG